jgi:hypothetical protein
MGIAVGLNVFAFYNDDQFHLFFVGPANIMNSVLTIFYVFTLLSYLIYSHSMVAKNFKDIEKKHVANKLEPFIEGTNHGSFHGAMFNVYFMYRKLLTVLILVLLEKLPGI